MERERLDGFDSFVHHILRFPFFAAGASGAASMQAGTPPTSAVDRV